MSFIGSSVDEMALERISELEDISVETSQLKWKKKKKSGTSIFGIVRRRGKCAK